MKTSIFIFIAALFLATGTEHAKSEPLLPPGSGFLGDWCMGEDANGHIEAHRKEVVGPCKKTLSIRGWSFRKNGDYCKMNDALRTMVHTQLIRYKCKNGNTKFVEIVWDRTGNTGLETLYIDDRDKDYWNDMARAFR